MLKTATIALTIFILSKSYTLHSMDSAEKECTLTDCIFNPQNIDHKKIITIEYPPADKWVSPLLLDEADKEIFDNTPIPYSYANISAESNAQIPVIYKNYAPLLHTALTIAQEKYALLIKKKDQFPPHIQRLKEYIKILESGIHIGHFNHDEKKNLDRTIFCPKAGIAQSKKQILCVISFTSLSNN